MSGIYVRGRIYWLRFSHRGKQYRESCGSPDPAIARALLKRRLAELGADTLGLRPFVPPAADKITVAELLDDLAADFRLRNIKSMKTSLCTLGKAKREFGSYRAVEITAQLVDAWYQKQMEGTCVQPKDPTTLSQMREAYVSKCKTLPGVLPHSDDYRNRPLYVHKPKPATPATLSSKGQTNDSEGNSGSNLAFNGRGIRGGYESPVPLGDRAATGDTERAAGRDLRIDPGGPGSCENTRKSVPRPATLNRVVSMLAQALSLAHRRGQIAQRPRFRLLSERGNARQGFLAKADLDALIAALPDYLQDMTRFAALTGWRLGAIRSLTWEDVDLAERTIRLRPEHDKAGTGLLIPLEGELWEIVARRYEGRSREPFTSHVFHGNGGRAIGDFRKAWESACQNTGLPGLLFHDLRRTAVRNYRLAGVDPDVIMRCVGHKTQAMLTRYNITDMTDLRDAQRKVQAHLQNLPTARKVQEIK